MCDLSSSFLISHDLLDLRLIRNFCCVGIIFNFMFQYAIVSTVDHCIICAFWLMCRRDARSIVARFSSICRFWWTGFLEMAPELLLVLGGLGCEWGAVANGKSSMCLSRFEACLCRVAAALLALLAALSNCTKCQVQNMP